MEGIEVLRATGTSSGERGRESQALQTTDICWLRLLPCRTRSPTTEISAMTAAPEMRAAGHGHVEGSGTVVFLGLVSPKCFSLGHVEVT